MEVVAGKNTCTKFLAFIFLRADLHWRANLVRKVSADLPFFKEIAHKELAELTRCYTKFLTGSFICAKRKGAKHKAIQVNIQGGDV
jgi:hypothetical protein